MTGRKGTGRISKRQCCWPGHSLTCVSPRSDARTKSSQCTKLARITSRSFPRGGFGMQTVRGSIEPCKPERRRLVAQGACVSEQPMTGWLCFSLSAGRRSCRTGGSARGVRGRFVHLFFGVVGAKPEFDESTGIRRNFRLPAVIGLVTGHGFFATGVPHAAGFTGEVVLADQSFLDRARAFRLDPLLAMAFPRAFACMAAALGFRRRMLLGGGGWGFGLSRRVCRSQDQNYASDNRPAGRAIQKFTSR